MNNVEMVQVGNFHASTFASALTAATIRLQNTLAAMSHAIYPDPIRLTIRLPDISATSIETLLHDLPTGYGKCDKGSDHIYVIELDGNEVEQMKKLMEEAQQTAIDYSRINPDSAGSRTLYVGRSRTLKARLRQHLGADDQGVFALHLERWARSVDARIAVTVLRFTGEDTLVVQAIEDELWANLKPAFGRQGGRP